nr:aminopeptidase P family N-terminal domain-containing protein [Streptococcus oralis]
GIDGILLTNEHSRRYMANFTGTAGVVLISKNRAQFITDFRYVEQASKQAVGYEIVLHAVLIIDEFAIQVKVLGFLKLVFDQDT